LSFWVIAAVLLARSSGKKKPGSVRCRVINPP